MMLDIPVDDKFREKELSHLLEELCEKIYSVNEIEDFANRFIDLYNVNSRAFHAPYGVISGCITGLYDQRGKDFVDQIAHNLNGIVAALKDMYEREGNKSSKAVEITQTYKSLIYLQDYVSMETIRVDQIARQFKALTDQSNNVLDETKKINNETIKIRDAATELNDNIQNISSVAKDTLTKAMRISGEAQNLKTEVVSILAIFAAIILAFTGGLTILGEAVATIKDAQLYSLLLVTILCIWGLFNTIYLLLYVVSRLSEKNLSDDCKRGDCKECADKEKCKGFRRFARRSPYVVGFNFFLVVMFVAIIFLNCFGVLTSKT